jgi:hypothetical protein
MMGQPMNQGQPPMAPMAQPPAQKTPEPSHYDIVRKGEMWVVLDETGMVESSFKTRPEAIRRINMLNGEERKKRTVPQEKENAVRSSETIQQRPMGGL